MEAKNLDEDDSSLSSTRLPSGGHGKLERSPSTLEASSHANFSAVSSQSSTSQSSQPESPQPSQPFPLESSPSQSSQSSQSQSSTSSSSSSHVQQHRLPSRTSTRSTLSLKSSDAYLSQGSGFGQVLGLDTSHRHHQHRQFSVARHRIEIKSTDEPEVVLRGFLWGPKDVLVTTMRRLRLVGFDTSVGEIDETSDYRRLSTTLDEHEQVEDTGIDSHGSLGGLDLGVVLVFVHQYSKMGGCGELMNGMARRISSMGFLSITFDLRGAGKSTGRCTFRGHSEAKDVKRVCFWAEKFLRARKILLVGSSAGAPIAGSVIDEVQGVKGYVGIGYVFGWWASMLFGNHYSSVIQSKKPKLFIMGDNDGFTSVSTFKSYFAKMAEPKRYRIVEGVGHFQLESPEYDDEIMSHIVSFMNDFIIPS